jgi:hypothetical protein
MTSAIGTYAGYQMIARDMDKSLQRVKNEPQVDRETQYYLANIGKVKTVDDLINNTRLFNYAMKAYGLEDMDYAKAFMKKVLTSDLSDKNSFANKLTDTRYQAIAKAFNFEADGDGTTTYVPAQKGVTDRYALAAVTAGAMPDDPQLQQQTSDYLKAVVNVKSIDDFLNNDTVYTYAMKAFGLDPSASSKGFIKQILEGGVSDPNSLANKQPDKAYAALAQAFNFNELGADTTTYSQPQQGTVDKYVRQQLENEAGQDDTGVQLALYFQRSAPSINSYYDILADNALSQVVRTALGFPDTMGLMDVDQQVSILKSKIDITDFQDPGKLQAFIGRFAAMWDLNNRTTSTPSAANIILGGSTTFDISTDLMLAIQQMKL